MTHKLKMVTFLVLSMAGAGTARADMTAAEARADVQKTFGFTPAFIKAVPDGALPGLWGEVKGFEMNPGTALPVKMKELIGLAVSSQTSCRNCIYSYSRCAKANGASQAEVGEAVAMAALTRRWSTHFNGLQLDETKFRAEIAKLVANAKAATPGGPAPKPIMVIDARTALDDIKQSFGFVPEFVSTMPPEVLPGAWLGMKGLEMNPQTALPGKYKSLISLAVASQVPCRYCVVADTEFAKLEGATEREIREAVTMAGMARHVGALLEGLEVDDRIFRRDIDRMIGGE
ncbi:MAG TPA: carboxymuconolactone decarboxylase family protein, partial [Sporichthya sp.]|nr:carboxymuconolactone decarboxylase family protein [Sporichthya sp.]